MMNRAYQQTLENRYQRVREQHAEIKEQYDNAPQAREARQREASPELYYSNKTRAGQARLGAWVMWAICFIIGSIFMVNTYRLPEVSSAASALLVMSVWLVLTILVGLACEMVVQFGLGIQPGLPNSDHRALRGILICGLVFLFLFATLLVLRTLVSLPVLIICQAFFEIFALITGSLLRALSVYYAHLPALRDRLNELQDEMDKLSAELAELHADTPVVVTTASPAKPTGPTNKDHTAQLAALPAETAAGYTHNGNGSKSAARAAIL